MLSPQDQAAYRPLLIIAGVGALAVFGLGAWRVSQHHPDVTKGAQIALEMPTRASVAEISQCLSRGEQQALTLTLPPSVEEVAAMPAPTPAQLGQFRVNARLRIALQVADGRLRMWTWHGQLHPTLAAMVRRCAASPG
ncbi:hypothetical protein GTZ99_13525 [Novosphingobium sp. FSY-8]|uniref:Uncharacterized protein n=1 Tax=Novosphingobium ovatum TaxID=1908523 RepID=A0ABW9XG97_9SPHN|nr:hypothetical protein [Novosphingobium ovatum]NBC37569.1 hypothetical protein [Novosphingobium ovatum]